ncbi:MAG TPA: hypothetical protein VNG12_00920 [Acidimicrobiales bacterium]|nr:hypothetical protein [Acidimicrobiales bacterium]
MSRLPASQRYKRHKDRYKRYEKQLPDQRVQVDVKFIQPICGPRLKKHYQLTAIDDTGLFNEKPQEWEDFYTSADPTAASVARPPTSG